MSEIEHKIDHNWLNLIDKHDFTNIMLQSLCHKHARNRHVTNMILQTWCYIHDVATWCCKHVAKLMLQTWCMLQTWYCKHDDICCYKHDITNKMSQTQCHKHNVTNIMLETRCYKHYVTNNMLQISCYKYFSMGMIFL